MATSRFALRSTRALFSVSRTARPFSISSTLRNTPETDFSALNARCQDTAEEYRRFQIETPLNPHFTNTNSTIANDMPNLGADSPPPELIKNADSNFAPKDAEPKNTERMTGGTQDVSANKPNTVGAKTDGELGVGELEGASFKVEPLRRTGEDEATMRARLLYQSRKRGTLESELLMSTFADANLASMSATQLQQYDLFLDENDWDIYYWATQEPTPTSLETAEGSGSDLATPNAQGKTQTQDEWKRAPAKGEWAQTVGTFKPAYRPVPTRWRDSEILKLLREHVESRSAGEGKVDAKGLGKMPEIKIFDN